MSGEALYERYKDALKRGHVASLRGRLEEALTAYAEAATIAPERSTPHTSAGAALLRKKRPADALRHYEAALRLSPHDEAALLGRAQALAALDRRSEAADAFDALAEHRAGGGKFADAVDAARRGLELAEGRERRRTLERLIERLRASEPGEPGRLALERALRVLEGPAVAGLSGALGTVTPAAEAGVPVEAATAAPVIAPEPPAAVGEPEERATAAPEPEAGPEPEAMTAEAGTTPGPEIEDASAQGSDEDAGRDSGVAEPVAPQALDTPEDAAVIRAALDRDLPADLDAFVLGRTLEDAIARGEAPTRDRLLDLAAALRRDGRIDAALDACYVALSLAPDDVGLHLALVELYDERGWGALATEKLALLERLVLLDDDAGAARRVAAARAARG